MSLEESIDKFAKTSHDAMGAISAHAVESIKNIGLIVEAQATRITELEAQLADAKQAARWESDLASHALADLEPYRKDAERYQWLCDKGYNYHGAMAGTGSMSICRGPYILLEPPSHNKFSNMILGKPAADAIIDAAIAEGKQA